MSNSDHRPHSYRYVNNQVVMVLPDAEASQAFIDSRFVSIVGRIDMGFDLAGASALLASYDD